MTIDTHQTAVITGAGAGIGASIAKLLADNKYSVFLLGRTESKINAVADEINKKGGKAEAIRVDVGEEPEVMAAFDTIKKKTGCLDLLVNNAGVIQPIAPFIDTSPQEWLACQKTNVFGPYLCCRYSVPTMLRQKTGGTIVNIGSGAAYTPLEGWSAYCTSKAALLMLMRNIHLEYGKKGIRSFSIRPGLVNTDMQEEIRKSGINKISGLTVSDLIPASTPARALLWLLRSSDDNHLGVEVNIRDEAFIKKSGVA